MSETPDLPVVVTFKGRHSATTPWIVVRGATTDEVADRIFDWFGPVDYATFPELVLKTQALYEAMEAMHVTPNPSQAVQRDGGSQPPPVQTGSAPTPTCQHGERQLRHSKPGSARAWSAWMCPMNPGVCKPVDAKTGKEWG